MPFDGGSGHPERGHVAPEEPQDLVDLVAAALEKQAPRRTPKGHVVAIPPEAPVLALWKKVAAHRDLLVRQITSWEEFRHKQRQGQRRSRLKNRWLGVAPEQLRVSRKLQAESDTVLTGWIEQLRNELGALDRGLRKLRSGSGKRELDRLAQAFHRALVADAVARVDAFVLLLDHNSSDANEVRTARFLATLALLHARDDSPRLLNEEATEEQARKGDIDLEQLVEDQRVASKLERKSRPRGEAIVAKVLGIKPSARILRR